MIIKLKLIDQSELVFPAKYIQELSDETWFLKSLIEDCIGDDNIEVFEIPETKDLIISIIHTLRSKKLCINDNISIEYFEHIADQWTLPKWVFDEINKYKEQKVGVLYCNSGSKRDNFLNHITIECKKCKGGYKIHENKSTLCTAHPGVLVANEYNCCGQGPESETCLVSYHVPTTSHILDIMRIANDISDD
jgi:hypothetical protein